MLKEMYVKNFILMDEVRLDFHEHMSAFTGETGAGKSLLMDAIGVLKGDRANASMIKQGNDKAFIEGVFQVHEQHPAAHLLQEAGYELEEGIVIANREISRDGKGTARINQRMVSVSFLREVISSLVDIHSQHDTQYLLNAKYHLQLLDSFCDCTQLRQEVASAYHTYHHIEEELQAALHQDYNEDDLEFLTFQMNEIDDADIKEGELDTLEEELKRLQAFEKISVHVHNALAMLDADGKGTAVIYEAYRELSTIHEDAFFEGVADKLQEIYYLLEDQEAAIKDHMEHFDYDEEHFHELQDRIFLIHKILRKYGPTIEDVKKRRNDFEQKIDSILHRADFVAKQEAVLKQARAAYDKVAKELHESRVKKAVQLEELILQQLKDLQLPNARFHVEIEPFEGNASGMDKVSFLISMNPGEALKPLNTTASGGELSRFMLGLKTVFTSLQGIETIIFDEIDTGVSGLAAFGIGRKMQEIAQHVQVFCVTHLSSVAACADQHYMVEKQQDANTTTTSIRALTYEERIKELAMISNNSISSSAIEAAEELFRKAQEK